ncbi:MULTISPECIES: hypothetical protein [Streptomyces]|uniref:Serine/threonine protein kinase n=1 Tax=Streptomyces sviceus (strain ATCC 29083 / DSM 924 / JCM 4929 / NBRC 13980 / NCIMB 11184 / NRRL 5439 / UC 5370) TaxID=463191 RepID=B5HVR2_STRX2|nr:MULTISPECIES: hypothetical protein [Streptomyces]EDY56917.1 conserved hypothetical protein [Streptomyces sviceus ATCC 29083]MYT07332.1 hypothetical protein [Streptomyces sp. SID5470]
MEEHGSADPADGAGRGHARESLSPGTHMTPYRWESDPEPGDRSRAVTLALLAVALVVALGAGGSVYAVLDDESPGAAPTAPPASP